MRSLGQNPTNTEVGMLLKGVGMTSDGLLPFSAFLNMMKRYSGTFDSDEAETIAAFRNYDRNGTGFVSVEELRHLATHMGRKDAGEALTDEEFESMLSEAGINATGEVDYVQFVKTLCR